VSLGRVSGPSPPTPPPTHPPTTSLQVIKILKSAFERCGLGLYLAPYGCLPTGYERGIIEVVPHTKSRAALGELSDRGLYDIFLTEFGAPGSPQFERARRNFIVSEAGYAIASYLLQVGGLGAVCCWLWLPCMRRAVAMHGNTGLAGNTSPAWQHWPSMATLA
jgi:hypothetical protein